jgi:hypothetical protein
MPVGPERRARDGVVEGQQEFQFGPEVRRAEAEAVHLLPSLLAFEVADGDEDLGKSVVPFRRCHDHPVSPNLWTHPTATRQIAAARDRKK